MSDLHLSVENHVATLCFDRPPVNALSASMMRDFIEALRRIDVDPGIRVTVLTATGRCFSAGVDLKDQLAAQDRGDAGPLGLGATMYEALLHGRKPLIAALNGHALGAGLGIAASCNILLAADHIEVGLPEINVGALGGARHALRLLGHSTVNRMLLTGHRLSARELARRGVIEAALPLPELMPAALAIAHEIASKEPTAVELARQCLANIETLTVLDGYRYESERSSELGRRPEAQALMRGFVQGRRS